MKLKSFWKHRGMNRFSSPLNMPEDWLWDIQNGYINRENDIQQRSGFAKYNTDAISGTPIIRYLFETKWTDGDVRMICRAGAGWYKEDGDAVWDSLDAGRTNDAQGQAIMTRDTSGNDIVIMVDGGAPRKCQYDGTSFGTPANLGGTPPSDATAVHQHNYHTILNSSANPMRVYVSALNNPEDYTTANDYLLLDLRYVLPEGDTVIGFMTLAEDYLVIICKKYIAVYNAPEDTLDWTIQQVLETGGVTNFGNIKHPTSDVLFIPGLEGINILTVGGVVKSDPMLAIAPYHRDNLATLTSSNWKYINGMIGRKRNHFYLCYPLTAGHEILVYSFDHNAIVGRYSGITAHSMCERQDGTILLGGTGGRAYTMDSGTNDDSAAITFKITTGYYYPNGEESYCVLRKVQFATEYTVQYTAKFDYTWDTQGAMTQITKVMTTNARNRDIFETENTLGRGHGVQLAFTNDTLDAIIKVSRWTIGYIPEGVK